MPVLGDVAHAHGAPLADGGVGDVLPAEEKLAGHQRFQTGQAVDQFRLAVAVDTRNADDLAPPHLEGHILHGVVLMQVRSHGHIFHLEDDLAGENVDTLEINGFIKADGVKAAGGDVAFALIDEHDVVVHDLGFHTVSGNPHEHHLPGIALAVQEIAPEGVTAFRIAADLEAAVPGGQARLHHRDHDQIHVARGHWFGKLRLRKGPRRFI